MFDHEPVPGRQSEIISDSARSNGVWLAVGIVEKTLAGLHNIMILNSPDGTIIGKYIKTHLSVDTRNGTIAKEENIFIPGQTLPVFQTPLGIIGIMICKDGMYSEVPRVLALKGAEIIIWANNRGFISSAVATCYSIVNCTVLVVSNRARGRIEGGGSVIISPISNESAESKAYQPWRQNILSEAGESEGIIYAEVDMDALANVRSRHRIHRVRKPELYKDLIA